MIRNYLKVAFRHLRRQKGYAFLNVFGLAVGLAASLLILQYVVHELSYDDFHEHRDRTYRVVSELQGERQPAQQIAMSPVTLGPVLLHDYPGVAQAVRLLPQSLYVAHEAQQYYEDRFFFADSTFFDVFTFPLERGDPSTALAEPFSVVLTPAAARRYFGARNPVGEMLIVDDSLTLQVTGVLAPLPSNAHLTFDFLASLETLERAGRWPDYPWWSFDYYTYVLLAPSARPADVGAEIYDVASRYVADQEAEYGTQQRYRLQPLTGIYLHSDLSGELGPGGSVGTVYTLLVIAVLILLIACVNFTNLTTARSMQRAKEVGMRKVVGARRSQLIRQFLGESLLAAFLALSLALVLMALFLPAFNAISGKTLNLNLLENRWLLPVLLGITALVGLAAGGYPAFVLSRFAAMDVLRGTCTTGPQGSALRKALVAFQFTTAVVLMVGTAVVYEQVRFMQHQDLGFESEQVVVLPIRGVQQRYESIKEALLRLPNVRRASASNTVPGRTVPKIVFVPEGADASQTQSILTVTTDYDFAETLGLELAAGRFFSPEYSTDTDGAFVINEAAVAHLGWTSPEEALGRQITWGWPGKAGRVVGVVKDFHHASLQQRIEPVVLHIQPSWFNYVSLKVDTEDLPATLAALELAWQRLVPNRPFDYFFLDEDFGQQYQAEERLGRLFGVFALLAIVITCLGLFGLSAFTAERRTKEIGIRKVLGASIPRILALLLKESVLLVLVAFIFACPIAYVAMNTWLEEFAYRIDLNFGTFLLAGALTLLIALLAVSYQAVRAALADPVESLRYE